MPARVLIVVRHGRTGWNAAGRFQGHADLPLDEIGRRQASDCAATLALALRRAGLGEPRLVSSDLQRAADTAGAIAGALGLGFRLDPTLREVDVGAWEGLTPAEAESRFPDEYRRWAAGLDVRRGGGETLEEAGRRVASCIGAELGSGGDGDEVLIAVGHGMALQAGLGCLRDRGRITFEGEPPHLGNARWLALSPPGQSPPPLR